MEEQSFNAHQNNRAWSSEGLLYAFSLSVCLYLNICLSV